MVRFRRLVLVLLVLLFVLRFSILGSFIHHRDPKDAFNVFIVLFIVSIIVLFIIIIIVVVVVG